MGAKTSYRAKGGLSIIDSHVDCANLVPASLGKGLFLPALPSATPHDALPLNSSLGIAIPVFGSSPWASGGSQEAGRGIGRENLKL